MKQFRGFNCSDLFPSGLGQSVIRPEKNNKALYNSRRYKQFRKWFLNRYPKCELCYKELSGEVQHMDMLVTNPEGLCKEGRCMAVSKSCHSKLTKMEQMGRHDELALIYDKVLQQRQTNERGIK